MGIFDDDFDLDRDLADLDGDGHVDAFEAALFFDEMEREGLDVPETTRLTWELNRAGWSLPMDSLEIEPCADGIAAAMIRQ